VCAARVVRHETGYQHVCLFTEVPAEYGDLFPLARGTEMIRAIRRRLAETGLSVCNIDFFPLTPDVHVAEYREGLETGAELRARSATAVINDSDDARAIANFADLCTLARKYALQIGLEFMPLSAVKTLAHAERIVRAAAQPNGAIVIDPLHLIRSGGAPADIQRLDPALVGYVQICDGPAGVTEDYLAEAIGDREIPGDGEFPLRAYVDALPHGKALAAEVPLNRLRARGVSPRERARRILTGTRRVLAVGHG
jgi:sugar phosphate isomerase/epimerase